MLPLLSGSVASGEALYVEDVFSAYTYTGTGAARSIVNGVDLAGEGGLVWIKARSIADHGFYDTIRGASLSLSSNTTGAQQSAGAGKEVSVFNNDGFSLGTDTNILTNQSSASYAAWTFRKARKFFDVVTYTGNGSARSIAHSLGVAPGMILIKRTNSTSAWSVYHRALANTEYLVLNTTAAKVTGATTYWNSTTPTDTEFSLGTSAEVNTNGATYVAYLFAHNTSEDGIIQCGSFTTDASGNATVSLGWETQYLLVKRTDSAQDWRIYDTARGWGLSNDQELVANLSSAEGVVGRGNPTASGFYAGGFTGSATYIYMAIRKGLMRTPTDATKVFDISVRSSTGSAVNISTTIPTGPDLHIVKRRNGAVANMISSRRHGTASQLRSSSTAAEETNANVVTAFNMNGVTLGVNAGANTNGATYVDYLIKEAKGFFDSVNYVGTGAAHTEAHNLGVAPDLMIVKCRSASNDWAVYYGDNTDFMQLNSTSATTSVATYWNDTTPTASVFTIGTNVDVNTNSATYVAYLFATVAGVSKIGTYTGTGATKQVDCGFAAGARFVMIKRVDDVGDWYFWDTTRGIVSGNDPYMLMNSTAAEVTSTDYIDPLSSGFEISSTAPAAINASGGTFLYLAIA